MRTVVDFPLPITHEETVWIPMSDGTRLAARIWMPENAPDEPVPAILEYLPYRRRDGTRTRDELTHPYIAGHGYACVRVDMRGSGDSDGIMHDEYLPQEQDDGLEVLAWLAEQQWCDGNIGMIGISWGGFNGLQIAARRPPELKAIITICSTDDRYADDIHYMGGTQLLDNLGWASTMFAYNFRPPDPATAGEAWREMWLERLDKGRFWLEPWLEHQRRDEFWEQGSICEDYSDITCPVFAVGGWADGYTNAIPRLLENLDVPRLGLIGPWGHLYPHFGVPGPAIGFLQESLRWWDRWLKGKETGIMAEPMMRAWMQESVPPATHYEQRQGRWVGEKSWPAAGIVDRTLLLARSRLADEGVEVAEQELSVQSPLGVGLSAGSWCPYIKDADLASDQREADGGSLVFDTEPLTDEVEIFGAPVAELELASDRPVAMVAVRLSDVNPVGEATRVTYGLLNLTHRESHAAPEPLEPGKRYRVRVQLNDIAQNFPVGHRIRLAISTSYWPIAWPAPEPVRLTVFTGSSSLKLPVRPRTDDDAKVGVPMPAEGSMPLAKSQLEAGEASRRIFRDLRSGETTLEIVEDSGTNRIDDIDLAIAARTVERYSFVADDPLSCRGEIESTISFQRGEWATTIRTLTRLTTAEENFNTYAYIEAFEGETLVFERTSERSFHRDLA